MSMPTGLAIYPSEPREIGATILSAVESTKSFGFAISTWAQLDIPGRFIAEKVLQAITAADFVVADISRLNFNVLFEIGYSIAKKKRVLLVLDESLNPEKKEVNSLGILDTIGYAVYQNSHELASRIRSLIDLTPTRFPEATIDTSAPIYVMDSLFKTDASVRTLSKIKKARIRFRSFDPQEETRLSAEEAYRGVAESVAVVAHLLSSNKTDYRLNNLRVSFVAGIAFALEKELLLFQEGDDPVPMDFRELVIPYKHPDDIDEHLNALAPKVIEALQSVSEITVAIPERFLERLDLGSPAAENEALALHNYYLRTDEFNRVLKGNVRLAVGRKGSGKTALFFQARDKLRENKSVFVLDLKPEGHQLKRFKHLVLELMTEAVREHAATAFWEYVLYLELCYKILEKDRQLHINQHELFEPYQKLARLYAADIYIEESDFSERMLKLVNRMGTLFQEKFGDAKDQYLTAGDVTSFLYQHDVPELRRQVAGYLEHKQGVVILFDNIDKGWPTRGIEPTDTLLVRGLLEATRKIERQFRKREIEIRTTVFLRSDVYELLVEGTPDRGKESVVSLDWTDPDMLRELLRKRIVHALSSHEINFSLVWNRICVSHVRGEESAEYLIERSLMRPRNLLKLVNHCRSVAVNLQHDKIQEEDIEKAMEAYSADMSSEIGLEVRDIFSEAEDVLYCFIGASQQLSLGEVEKYLRDGQVAETASKRIIELLLWFGFFGVVCLSQDHEIEVYIYDVQYDLRKLKRLAGDLGSSGTPLCIHKAFWPFLEIRPSP